MKQVGGGDRRTNFGNSEDSCETPSYQVGHWRKDSGAQKTEDINLKCCIQILFKTRGLEEITCRGCLEREERGPGLRPKYS